VHQFEALSGRRNGSPVPKSRAVLAGI